MPSTNEHETASIKEAWDEDFIEVLRGRCYHEAAHAIFAYHDEVEIDEVWASDERGGCSLYRAELYKRYEPWGYARFCLAGAYATYIAETLEHPKPEQLSLSQLREDAQKVPEGDAWQALVTLEHYARTADCPFGSIEDAHTALVEDLRVQVEDHWDELEAIAFELWARYWESGKKLGRLGGGEVVRIIESTRKEGKDA
jgi:hypothetical protein